MDKGLALLCEPDKLFFPLTASQAAWTTGDRHLGWDRPGDPAWSTSRNSFKPPKSLPLSEQTACLRSLNERQTWGFFLLSLRFLSFPFHRGCCLSVCSSRVGKHKIKETEESPRNQEYSPLVSILGLAMYLERKNPREHTCCCQTNLYFIAQKQLPGQTSYPTCIFFP